MLYAIAGFTHTDRPFVHTAPELRSVFESAALEYQDLGRFGTNAFRTNLRFMGVVDSRATRLYGQRQDGTWIPLDIEVALNAATNPVKAWHFAQRVCTDTPSGALAYSLRLFNPSGKGREDTSTHASLSEVFAAISAMYGYAHPHKPGYAHWLWRTGAEPHHIALHARWKDTIIGTPLTLAYAETAFSSHHAMLDFQHQLSTVLTPQPDIPPPRRLAISPYTP